MKIELHTNEDDWRAIYINGEKWYEGHRIPDFIWLDLFDKAGQSIKVVLDDFGG